MGIAGASAPAAAWPATIAARRAQLTQALAVLGIGGGVLAVAGGVIASIVVRGGLDEPAGIEVPIAVLSAFWAAAFGGFGIQLLRRWQRPRAILASEPWVITTGSAVTIDPGSPFAHDQQTSRGKPIFLVAVVLPGTGAIHVLSVIDGHRPRARLVADGARPLWVARRGDVWAVSPAGGTRPMHAHPVTRDERGRIGKHAVKQVRRDAAADAGIPPGSS